MSVAIITVLGTVVVAVFVFAGTLVTTRQGRRAADQTREQHKESAELTSWRELAHTYLKRLEHLEGRQDTQGDQLRDAQRALHETELLRKGMAEELREERTRVSRLEERFQAAVDYIQSLWTLLRHHDIEPPSPPDGLNIH